VIFDQNGYRSIGYERRTGPAAGGRRHGAPGGPLRCRARSPSASVSDICIPVDLSLAQVLRGGAAPDALIIAALREGPATGEPMPGCAA
jgi:hypothetical protein